MDKLADKVDMLSKTLVDQNRKELNRSETEEARKCLVNQNLLFPRSVKSTTDPILMGQEYGLISFTPAHDVQPNKNGIYGVMKLRGNFSTIDESEKYAEKLIRTHDSYNEIHVVRTGQVFPLTKKAELVEETINVDINKEADKIVSESVKEKRNKEKVEMKTIQEREKKLLKENQEILKDEYKQDPIDEYTMLRVKKAQLMWTLIQTKKRINDEILPALKKTKKSIMEMNEEYPEFDKMYYDRYIEARKSVGIENQDKLDYSYFMKYLLDDNDISLNDV